MASSSQHVVFISGASAGIGLATARRFAQDGARLVLLARREDRLRALAAELGVPCHILVADVQDTAGLVAAVASLPPPFCDVTILLNNAGLAWGMAPAQQASWTHWDAMMKTNMVGLVALTHALLPGMVKRNAGHIINLGSVAGTYPYPGGNVYGATKAFVHQFSLNLRSDVLGTRVRVTNIEPGMVETEFSLVRFDGDAQKAKAVYTGMVPLSPEDVADAIHWTATRPGHVNINTVELMPVQQAFGAFAIKRDL